MYGNVMGWLEHYCCILASRALLQWDGWPVVQQVANKHYLDTPGH